MSNLNRFLKVLNKVGYPNPDLDSIVRMVDYNLEDFLPDLVEEVGEEGADDFIERAIGKVYNGDKGIRSTFGISSGFRAPNVDDLTKVFDTRTGYVLVPNKNLKPEYTYNAEWTISKSSSLYSLGASVFYTLFNNALVVDKYTWNGKSAILYQGVLSDVYATQNKAKANLYGFNVNGRLRIMQGTELNATYTYTKGNYIDQSKRMPLDHIPPAYGRFGLKHNNKVWNAEIFSVFNSWKRIADYNLNGEDNEIYATKDGMPSWMTLNFNAQFIRA